MSIFQAIIYGIIQGIGEFLPISSSAHLAVTPWLLGWNDPGTAFDIALHLGTLVAVILFFWKDWIKLGFAGLKGVKTSEGKLFWFLVAATIPGGIAGLLLEDYTETTFRNPGLIGLMLIIMGAILYTADKFGSKKLTIEKIDLKKSLLIGVSQALAIIPGVSRSGITMSTGLFLGINRESTARFSFLLSTPLIVGAGLVSVRKLFLEQFDLTAFLVAFITAAIVGLLSIKFLIEYLKKKGFGIFVLYRFIFGILLIGLYFTR